MTVSENINPKVTLEGPFDNGAELVFNFPYADPEHIKVKEGDTLLTYNVDYEVLSHSIEGPTPVLSQVVKLKKAITGNVTIYRVTPIDQQAEFPQAQKFNSGKLNEALDKICMQQQEQQEAIDRSLKITNSLVGKFDMMLPTPSASDVLRWDVTGSKLENYDIKEFEAGVQAQIDIIEDTANAAAANASDAVSTANAATVVANSASSTASTASTNASAAVSTANEASTTATNASAVASAASTTATNAKNTADAASAKVDQFGKNIDAVIEAAGKINELEEGITTATNAANTATSAANTASTAAESATNAAATATAKAEEVSQALGTKEDKANKGVAGGYASLGEDGKVPAEQLAVDLSTVQKIAEKGVANGYAGLDAEGKVPSTQLPSTGWTPSLLQPFWSEYKLDRMDMLRADTFSWQNGVTYSAVYNLLFGEYNNAASTEQTENGITFKVTPRGFRIADATQEQAILNLYNTTGVAGYFIIDTANTRFKLPRMKYLASVKGAAQAPVMPYDSEQATLKASDYASKLAYFAHTNGQANGTILCNNKQGTLAIPLNQTQNPSALGASFGGNYGTWGGTFTPMMYADLSNTVTPQTLDNMYLYFYVGEYTQTVIEQTAGLNAELFNVKMDRDLSNRTSNIHFVIETSDKSILPSWYRIYDDGWCEQGGYSFPAIADITFLKPFKDINFTVITQATAKMATSGISAYQANLNYTTHGFKTIANINIAGYVWQASGYIK